MKKLILSIATLGAVLVPSLSQAAVWEELSFQDFSKVYQCGTTLIGLKDDGKGLALGSGWITDTDGFVYGGRSEQFNTIGLFKSEYNRLQNASGGYVFKESLSTPGKGSQNTTVQFNAKNRTLSIAVHGTNEANAPVAITKSYKCRLLTRESAAVPEEGAHG